MTQRVVVHAGVDTQPTPAVMRALAAAAQAALEGLAAGRTCVAAAADAVVVLEDEPELNAGYGSVLNAVGEVETDASVADGANQSFAAVGALQGIRHPVRAAQWLLESGVGTVMLAGEGARQWACAAGLESADLRTAEQQRIWAEVRDHGLDAARSQFTGRTVSVTETVGAIVASTDGLAAAASTGGLLLKPPGRIGDSAIFGAGIYASEAVAVLCSGDGEASIELQLAAFAAGKAGRDGAGDVAVDAMEWAHQRKAMRAGIVVYDKTRDQVIAAHNATSFPVVSATHRGVEVIDAVMAGRAS